MHNKNHYHSLHPFSADPHHHFYCKLPYCGQEFWTDEKLEGMIQDMYESGHEQGLEDSKNPKIMAEYEEIKLMRQERLSKKVIESKHEEPEGN